MSFKVTNPGILTLLQDRGRHGYQHLGVTTGGPMDEFAFAWANHLLGNHANAAQLEIALGMLSLEAQSETCIALTGADLDCHLNDQPIENWRTHAIKAGDVLAFKAPKSGVRAYLAVVGGFTLSNQLGSCATVVREGIGGLRGDGSIIAMGDIVPFTPTSKTIEGRVPLTVIPDYGQSLEVGVIPGYQYASFSSLEVAKFFSSEYEISPAIDRMGYRLSGVAIQSQSKGIISEGIAYGAIQIPADGQPIVLMKDRQTIGGYPKIGCLSALGASQLSQRGPGAKVCFYPMDIADAEVEQMLFNRTLVSLNEV